MEPLFSYARLGLLPTLNPRAKGGSEGIMRRRTTMVDIEQPQDSGMATKEVLPIGHGRIIRDAAGNIVDIQLCDSGDSSKEMGEDKDMLDEETQQVQANVVSSEREKWIQRTSNTGNTELIHGMWVQGLVPPNNSFTIVRRPRKARNTSGQGPSYCFQWREGMAGGSCCRLRSRLRCCCA